MGGPYAVPYKGSDAIKPRDAKKAKQWFKNYLKDTLKSCYFASYFRKSHDKISRILELTDVIVEKWFGDDVWDWDVIPNLLVLALHGILGLIGKCDESQDADIVELRELLDTK